MVAYVRLRTVSVALMLLSSLSLTVERLVRTMERNRREGLMLCPRLDVRTRLRN